MPLPARKPSVSAKGLSKTYGSPVGPLTPSSHKKRPEWNDRQTDDNKYKLSKEELLKRKKMYVSKHNVLASYNASQSLSAKKRTVSRSAKPRGSSASASKDTSKESPHMRDPLLEMTSLDYLNDEDSENVSSDSASEAEGSSDDESAGRQRKIRLDETIDMSKFVSPARKECKSPAPPRTHSASSYLTPTSKSVTPTQRRPSASKSVAPKQGSTPAGRKQSSAARKSQFMKGSDTLVGTDVLEMLQALYGELQYYEELSGRRSVFDFSELNSILDTYSEVDEAAEGTLPRKHVSLEGVVRYLIQLVCQSMTYLLQNEVKISQQQTDYDSLSKRVEILTTLVTGGSNPENSSMRFSSSSAPAMPIKAREEAEKHDINKRGADKHDHSTVHPMPSSAAAPSLKTFTTPQRREVSFSGIDDMDKPRNTPSSQGITPPFSHKMGSATSDWLFASPLPKVSFNETNTGHNVPSSKLTESSPRSDREMMATPPVMNDASTEAGGKTVDLFGRELPSRRAPSSITSTPTSGSKVSYDICVNSDWTPKVSGRTIQEDNAVNASYDKAENNYYFDMLQNKNDEDETDKLYQENLVSVARKLYAESLERSNLDDSENTSNCEGNHQSGTVAESPRLPPRSPAPVTRVEKLQKSLLANRHAPATSRTFLTDLRNSHDHDSVNITAEHKELRFGSSSTEQHSFGTIPPPPPPAPHTAPVHPYQGMRLETSGGSNIRSQQPPRHVYDATSGSY